MLERDEFPELQSKEVKREKLQAKKDTAEGDAASRVSTGKL